MIERGTAPKQWGMTSKIVAAVIFAITCVFTFRYYYQVPIFDHWDLVNFYALSAEGNLHASDLTALHGSHFHTSGYLVMLGIAKLTDMAHWGEVLSSLIFAGVAYLGWLKIFRRSSRGYLGAARLAWIIPFGALFFFSLDQAENWLMGWQVAVFIHLAGVVWCIEALTRGETRIASTAIAIAAASIAIYGYGTGWALLPIGLILLLLGGNVKSTNGLISILMWVVFSFLVITHFTKVSASASNSYLEAMAPGGGVFENLGGLILYAVKYAASPITRFSSELAIPMFVAGVALVLWAIKIMRKERKDWIRAILPYLAFCAYVFGAGLLTGIGRLENFGSDSAFLSRYITFGNLFWVAVFSLVFLALPKLNGRSRKIMIGSLALIAVFKLATIGNVLQRSVPNSMDIREAALDMRYCYPNISVETRARISAPHQNFEKNSQRLKRLKISVFRHAENDGRYTCNSP